MLQEIVVVSIICFDSYFVFWEKNFVYILVISLRNIFVVQFRISQKA
jgi:hypothetical protein